MREIDGGHTHPRLEQGETPPHGYSVGMTHSRIVALVVLVLAILFIALARLELVAGVLIAALALALLLP